MKLELEIRDDVELREFLRNMIKGQVKSILRSELSQIIKDAFLEEFGEKVLSSDGLHKMMEKILSTRIEKELGGEKKWVVDRKISSIVKDSVYEIVKEQLRKE